MKVLREVFLIVVILLAVACVANANIHNVPEDFETVQAAIDACEAEDTVIVHPGEYVGTLTVPNQILTIGSLILTTGNNAYIDSTILDGGMNNNPVVTFTNVNRASLLTGFTITGGGGVYGAGVLCEASSPTLSYLKIINNAAGMRGGAINLRNGSNATVEHVVMNGNSAPMGGGLGIEASSPTISYCLIANNTGRNQGGGVYVNRGEPAFSNITFYNNQCGQGSSLHFLGNNLSITNSISWNNQGADFYAMMGRISLDYSAVEGGRGAMSGGNPVYGDNNIVDNPQFVNADAGDFHIQEGSPCIDAGDPDSPEDPDGTRADMGMFPFNQVFPTPIITVSQDEIDFGNVLFADGAEAVITISNEGDAELIVTSIAIEGEFYTTAFEEELIIEPGNSHEQLVAFNPQQEGELLATLTITSNDEENPEIQVSFAGIGVEAGGRELVVPDDYETIQAAIDAAVNADTIFVGSGQYLENINFSGKSIAVIGNPDAPQNVVIDGGEAGSVVVFMDNEGNSLLEGFTLTNGAADFGGGINLNNTSPILRNLIISNNVSREYGGGLACRGNADVTIERVSFVQNSSSIGGGGLYSSDGTNILMTESTLNHNYARLGGGLYFVANTAELNNVEVIGAVEDERFMDYGGGMFICESVVTMDSVLVSGCQAARGGGLSIIGSNINMTYSLLYGNSGYEMGSGIYSNNSVLSIDRVTIVENVSLEEVIGSGICSDSSEVGIVNSIFWGNSHDEGSQGIFFGGSVNISYSVIEGGQDGFDLGNLEPNFGDGVIADNPLFAEEPENGYFLTDNSPCIDTGSPETELDPDSTRADVGMNYFHHIISEVENQHVVVPSTSILESPYPNPFNSTTIIEYSLKNVARVSLKVIDLSGRTLRDLVNETVSAGSHQVTFNAGNLPSGEYLILLNADGQNYIRKVVLTR